LADDYQILCIAHFHRVQGKYTTPHDLQRFVVCAPPQMRVNSRLTIHGAIALHIISDYSAFPTGTGIFRLTTEEDRFRFLNRIGLLPRNVNHPCFGI